MVSAGRSPTQSDSNTNELQPVKPSAVSPVRSPMRSGSEANEMQPSWSSVMNAGRLHAEMKMLSGRTPRCPRG